MAHPGDARSLTVSRGTRCEVFDDVWLGDLPGTIVWPSSFGEPPAGYACVRYLPSWDATEIAVADLAGGLRLVYGVKLLGAWLRSGGRHLMHWLRELPVAYHWMG